MKEGGEDLTKFSYDEVFPEIEISLHTIIGSHHPKAMRIMGRIGL